jgi:amino acid adenylation domain-containing protein
MPKTESAAIVEASHPALRSIQAPEGRPSDSRDEGGLVALPHDMPKVPGVAYRPRLVSFEFAEDLQVRLSNEPEGRTLVLTAFVALLYRYSQQTTLTLGVLRDGVVRALVIEANAQQTGQALAAQISRQLPNIPPWNTLGKGGAHPQVTVALVGGTVPEGQPPSMFAEHELHLSLAHPIGRGVVTYNANLFAPDTIARLLLHFEVLAKSLCDNPGCLIGQLPLLTPGETHQLLVDWRPAARTYPQRPLFHEVSRHARERPDAIAVMFKDSFLSYGELDSRSNRLAQYLRRQGVRGGAPVAVCLEPSTDIAVCLLGILKAGGAFVPLDPAYPAKRQAVIVEDVRPRVLLTQSHLRRPPSTTAVVLDIHECFGTGGQPGPLDAYPSELPEGEISLDDVAFVVYTSGTTGKPKGVTMTHGNLVNYIWVAKERYRFGPADIQPAMARFSFSITMFELLSPLVAGGRLILLERDHVLDFRRLLATLEKSTVLHASPSLLRKLIAYVREQDVDVGRLDGLRHVSSGGDMVSADLMEDLKDTFRKAELFVIYGCSEIACMGCTYEIPRDRAVTRNQVGRPFANVIVRICDNNRRLVPIGVPGEIYIGGAGVARGYLNQADLTEERFVAIDGERYYRTGDIGRYDEDGEVEMLGRSDFQIKLRGMRIELAEIEQTLRRMDGVREAVVAARERHGEKALVAYVVFDPARKSTVPALRRFLQERLPDYMVPSAFVVLEALPVNVNMKVDRRALPAPSEADLGRERVQIKARDATEERLLAIWRNLLRTDAIGVEDSFFDVGGNSLSTVNLMVEIERQFGKPLPLSTLLTEPTVAALARLLRDSPAGQRPTVVTLREGGKQPPIFFVHDGEGEILPYRTLAMKLGSGHPVYGLQPKGRVDYPMLHSRLADVADYYCEQILRIQPQEPYLLSGLCIGGFIAFEIARRLRGDGRKVAMVALLDAAHVKARPKSITVTRLKRFSTAMKEEHQRGAAEQAVHVLRQSSRKIGRVLSYEARARLAKAQNQTKMRLYRLYLDHGWELPSLLAHIPVRVVLRFAEKEYVVPEPYDGEVLLFRATQKSSAFDGTLIDDTPYVDLFQDRHLGWEGRTTQGFIPFDIPAGHSSMLQEPHVGRIAESIQSYLDRSLSRLG